MRVEAPCDQTKGSHRDLPKQYGLTTSFSAQLASHSSQNSSPFLNSLLFLHNFENVVVNVVLAPAVDFDFVLEDFGFVLEDFDFLLEDFDFLLEDFDFVLGCFDSMLGYFEYFDVLLED